ncbi:hypothetical protein NC651_000288 [Populus alba x Populus x berolinensis]|nr:hypothetical protein NC651_000288 [Populus alba x Populus x berolinensis]
MVKMVISSGCVQYNFPLVFLVLRLPFGLFLSSNPALGTRPCKIWPKLGLNQLQSRYEGNENEAKTGGGGDWRAMNDTYGCNSSFKRLTEILLTEAVWTLY